jgi:hypothetical protein
LTLYIATPGHRDIANGCLEISSSSGSSEIGTRAQSWYGISYATSAMAKTFVAIADPVHALLRELTRSTRLALRVGCDGAPVASYELRPAELPEAYWPLAALHALEGLPLCAVSSVRWRGKLLSRAGIPERVNYFDAIRLDQRCCRDLRLRAGSHIGGMFAGELLAFGAGALRARNDAPGEPLHRRLWDHHGRLHTRHEIVYAKIKALLWSSLPLFYQGEKESFDSTNLIYGDALGELEQLWERRADTAFLEQISRSLRPLRGRPQLGASLQPPLNLEGIAKLHLRAQSLWKTPPQSARSLLRRIEYLLEHTQVDKAPVTIFRRNDSQAGPETKRPEGLGGRWAADRSGYDGWLSG